jgi:AcrR family transcriptional regulator
VSRPYHGASQPAFGTPGGRVSLPKPLKRPMQDRAKFTVQALYDGFVRICVRDGWDSVSTRALAEETGYAVGTLYEYFPNRDALLSGYVRHAIEARLELAREEACIPDLVPEERVARLVRAMLGSGHPELPPLLPELALHEHRIADTGRHRRMFNEIVDMWERAFAAGDATRDLSRDAVEQLVIGVWGAWRYALLVRPAPDADDKLSRAIEHSARASLRELLKALPARASS